jgi:hypothetical protein
MRKAATLIVLVSLAVPAVAQEAQLRAKAIEMAERAVRVSRSTPPPSQRYVFNESVVTFRTGGADGKLREGSYTRLFAGKAGTREEFTFGDFHLVRISLPDRIAFLGPSRVLPPEMSAMLQLIPIQLWHLDDEDVVREIRQTNRNGLAVTCTEFDTIRGDQREANELCYDAKTGSQVYARNGNVETDNAAFFDFMGGLLPGRITQSSHGAVVMEIQVTRRVVDDPVGTEVLTPPPDALIGMRCETFRRPLSVSMPMPPGNGGTVTNIVVLTVIGVDGLAHDPVIASSDRPDLNDEAIKTVKSWTFTPAQCNGHPNPQDVHLVVRFQGR